MRDTDADRHDGHEAHEVHDAGWWSGYEYDTNGLVVFVSVVFVVFVVNPFVASYTRAKRLLCRNVTSSSHQDGGGAATSRM
jgi:hypothetical protein